ncbi:hypothetical protein [Salininema proteolyticum]|uniref:DUF1542 domain-containing protein n=1 Tax=Salininema proteolyticum TaxID=1607685 RepID=A0ABV8TVW5_9ACTN
MELWVFLLIGAVALIAFTMHTNKKKAQATLADAEAEARQLYDRLGGQSMNLTAPGDNPAAGQALADAGERYTAAGSALERASSVGQYRAAAQTAIEGLYYIRAGREAMGMDPGPEVPQLRGSQGTGQLKEDLSAEVDGQRITASPRPDDENTHYYPGGRVDGRPVPAGWYSTPWWKPALAGVAGGLAGVMVFNALLAPAYAGGMVEGADPGAADGDPTGGDAGGEGDAGDGGGDDFGDMGDMGGMDF